MRQRLLWIFLTGLLIAAVVFIVRHNDVTLGQLSSGNSVWLVYKIALLIFVGASVLIMFRGRFVQALAAALLWVVLALVLVVGYSYRYELRDVADRVMAELVPGHVITRGRTVEVARTVNGDFDVTAQINGARVAMVLDTGASSVVLTREDAKAAGLPLEVLAYTTNIETANGRTRAAPVTLDRLAIGGLVEHSVAALVAQPGQLKTSLLGMSFPQPAAKLGSPWRPITAARISVARNTASQPKQTDKKPQRHKQQKTTERDFQCPPRQPMRKPRAVWRNEARNRRHQYQPDQRHEAERQWRQQRLMRQAGKNEPDGARDGNGHTDPRRSRHCIVDRLAVNCEHDGGQRTAADAHERSA